MGHLPAQSRPARCYGLLRVGSRRGPFRYTEERLLTAKTNKELLAFGEGFRVFSRQTWSPV